MPDSLFHILLVEDNPGDVELIREALAEGKGRTRLHVAEDGQEALDFLNRKTPYENAVRPHVILLDLNMPRKEGTEVLKDIKQDERLRDIPVIVMTSSRAERDIAASYNLHANCYIIKPVDLDHFTQTVRAIEHFWLEVAQLPARIS